MKKTIATLTLIMIAGVIFAQEGAKIGFRASPLIGWATVVNDSTKTKPDGLETKAGLGFSFDFVFTYGFSENVALRTGVNIATKNVSTEQNSSFDIGGNTTTIVGTQKTNFTAVEIPVGLKFRSPEIGDGIYIIGHFGMNAEINVQNRINYDITTTITNSSGTTSTTLQEEQVDVDGISPFTASFVPGAGVDWEFDWGMVEMALTYHWGLMSYTDPDQFGGQRSRLNYVALNLGYFF